MSSWIPIKTGKTPANQLPDEDTTEITLPPAPIHHTPRWVCLLWRTLELLALLGAGALAVVAVLTATGWRP